MPSVLIVENILLIRYGLRQLLSHEYSNLVLGEAQTIEEAEIWLAKRHWDLVILGIALRGKDGFYVLDKIRRRRPSTRALVLSMYVDPKFALRVRRMGASGHICKTAGLADLLSAVKSVLAGKKYFQDPPSPKTAAETEPRHSGLSGRERAVMLALAAGKRTGEIANELNLSTKTISTYKRRIFDKLGLVSTADLVRYVDQNFS